MRNTKAFKDAVAVALSELARRGFALRLDTIIETVRRRVRLVAERLGIQTRSPHRHFHGDGRPDCVAGKRRRAEEGGTVEWVIGEPPTPPVDNPELALILAGVPTALEENGGDLYLVVLGVAVNAWMAGHIHGEDGCTGCQDNRGRAGTDWQARMDGITTRQPDIARWFDRDVWTAALNDTGYTVTRS
ncbi:hypothetical protein [Streptomyces sp. H27-H5]|uniref:hypothetical protein n=1 Tax=Streptomyces sp. H27-H5 TaxID=2996460 RepID=UPI00226D46D6|nr:hypothetical protein [Streptomyces sp. H27-H5]MCY0956762.1 hypothetical protein [Streptomyces sp. H27-H5]